MSGSGRKAVVALLGSVVLAGLMMPASANAATYPSVSIKVCNDTSWRQFFALSGKDQNGKWHDQSIFWGFDGGECDILGRDRWATGQHLQVHYLRNRDKNGNLSPYTMTSYISKDFRDGITVRVHVARVGP